jgi:hypothetical protein
VLAFFILGDIMAKKMKEIKGKSMAKESKEPEYKPTIYFDDKQLPAIKDWEVGKTYVVAMKIKMVSLRLSEHNKRSATFEVYGVKTENTKKKKY